MSDILQRAIAAVKAGDKDTGKRLLARALYADPRNEEAWRWLAYAVDDVARKRECLERVLAIKPCEVDECLLSYDYPALQGVPESIRRDFAFAVVWKRYSYEVWDANEPLAIILGTDYTLDTDIETTSELEPTSDEILPVSYAQRAELWPELTLLSTLSLAARKIFVRAMQYVQIRSGLVEYSRLTDSKQSTPEFREGLTELAEAGLIDPNPSTTDLLMDLTVKELKQFAFEHRVESHGPKHRLVKAIVTQVGQDEIRALLDSLSTDTRYLRPLVGDLPLLKKLVWAETHRIELYLQWVERVHCLRLAPPEYPIESSPPANDMEPWIGVDYDPRKDLTETEMQIVREIWDAKCDEIVQELADEYAWYAPWYISDAIVAYVPSDKLEAFKQACEDHKTRSWYNVLMYCGERRLAQMKIKYREPHLLECAGCGKQFLEWSICLGAAERVGYKIYFCDDCYSKAFWSYVKEAEPVSMSQDDMLNRLAELAAAVESVPSATFVKSPNLAAVSEEKQIAIVKVLLAMPPYETYVEEFGSWLHALILAGVLEDGTQRTPRGTRCIAADGHECRSLAEKTIDDWLSAHGIPHEIEPVYPYHFRLNPSGRMRADWKVGEVFIEYAGLMDDPEYAAKMETKQELATELGISLIVIEPKDILSLDNQLGQLVNLRHDRTAEEGNGTTMCCRG